MVRLVVPFRLGRTKDGKLVCEHAHDVDYLAWVEKDRRVNRRLSGIVEPNVVGETHGRAELGETRVTTSK